MRSVIWSADCSCLPPHPRLAVDAHADLHLGFADGEGGFAGARHGAGGERNTHGAGVGQGLFGDRARPHPASRPGQPWRRRFEGKDHAGHAAPAAGFGRRGRGHIVLDQNGAHFDVFKRRHLGSHVEVHDIAAVVAVDVHHALAAVDAPGDCQHLVGGGRSEDVTDCAAVQHALCRRSRERREVARAAARSQGDLASTGAPARTMQWMSSVQANWSGWALTRPSNISGTKSAGWFRIFFIDCLLKQLSTIEFCMLPIVRCKGGP